MARDRAPGLDPAGDRVRLLALAPQVIIPLLAAVSLAAIAAVLLRAPGVVLRSENG